MTGIATLLPYQLHANQLAFDHQFLVVEKSRRIGLSFGIAKLAVTLAGEKDKAENVYYIGYNLDMAREFIGYCADDARDFDTVSETPHVGDVGDIDSLIFFDGNDHYDAQGHLIDLSTTTVASERIVTISGTDGSFLIGGDPAKSAKAFRIDLASGKSVVALPSSPRSVRGKQGVFIVDEAAFHDHLEELIKAILAALIWGGRVVVISTHDGTDNYFNTLIEEIRTGRRDGHVMRITFAEAIADGLYRRICESQGKPWSLSAQAEWEAGIRRTYGDAAAEELDVIPARGSGIYLARATIIEAMSRDLPVVRLRCEDGFERRDEQYRRSWLTEFLELEVAPWLDSFDPARRSFMGQDFARSGDVSPVMFGQHDEHMRLVVRLTIEMRNVPFSDQEYVIDWLLRAVPHFAGAKMDARGNGSALAEKMQQRFGFDLVDAVMATDKTYLGFMPLLKAGIEDRAVLLPFDEGVLDDLRMIKLVRGIPKIPDSAINVKEDGKIARRHGDTAIAAMHLVAAAAQDPGDFLFLSAGRRISSGYDLGRVPFDRRIDGRTEQGLPTW